MAPKKKTQLRLKPKEKDLRLPVHIRFSEEERSQAQEMADTYTGGDLSKWVRHAALSYRPKVSELVEVQVG